jgi:hypothetical protein
MADARLERLFESLGASFEAAVAREEEVAAQDLALALRNDRCLGDDLVGNGGATVVLGGWPQDRVTEVGRDYLGTGLPLGSVVVMDRAVVRRDGQGPAVRRSERNVVEVLRGWARAGVRVRALTSGGELTGRLVVVGRDYLVIKGVAGESLAGLDAVAAIRIVHGD